MSVKTKTITAPDGTQVSYNVLVCDAPACTKEANVDTQHQSNWLTVTEYWTNADGGYGMFESNFCSRGHMTRMNPMPTPPKFK